MICQELQAPIITFPIEKHLETVKSLEEQALKEIEDVLAKKSQDIASLIIEPIQGEGGDNHFRPEFLQLLRRICDKNKYQLAIID